MKPPLNTPRWCTSGGIFLRVKEKEMAKDIGEIWKELTDSNQRSTIYKWENQW